MDVDVEGVPAQVDERVLVDKTFVMVVTVAEEASGNRCGLEGAFRGEER